MPQRRPWSLEELAELERIKPRQYGAVPAFAKRWRRTPAAVAHKLLTLRARGDAEDVMHVPRPAFPVHRFD
jgi:hypothetical protein